MLNFVNPLDLIIAIVLLFITIVGIKNGFVNECKKIISLFIATFLSKLLVDYISSFPYIINPLLLYFIIFTSLIYIISLLVDLSMHEIPTIEIEKNINKLIGGMIGILKGFIIISLSLFILELSPIQSSIKDKVFLKANKVSFLFKTCNNIKDFLMH